MGTTQRIIPGVSGEPNWSSLNVAITSIANTVEKEQDLGDEADSAIEKEKQEPSEENKKIVRNISSAQGKLSARRSRHFNSALKNLIRTGGGRVEVSKGRSSSLGKSGLRKSKKFSGFVRSVHTVGLQSVLKELGFGSLKGKRLQDVIDYLLIYFADTSSGMDEVAANIANCEILEFLTTGIDSIEQFEDKLKTLIEENSLSDILCKFYGLYLFEHLSQRFQEKITQIKGEAVSVETFKIIKEDVLGQVKIWNTDKNISELNWKGSEGKDFEEKIFNSIIQIFE